MADIAGIPFNGGMDSPSGTGAQNIVETCAAIATFLVNAATPGTLADGGNVAAIQWESRTLCDSSGDQVYNWGTGAFSIPSSGSPTANMIMQQLYDQAGQTSIDWQNRLAYDAGGNTATDYAQRRLLQTDGVTISLDWSSGLNCDAAVMVLNNLPTADTGVPGQLYVVGGFLMVST